MPIGKVICSSSFTATTRYVLEKEQAQWLGGTMLGETAEELTLEFEFSRRNNPTIERPCLHLILSYSKMDEERQNLDQALLAAIAQEHFVGCAVLSRWHQPLAALDPEVYRQQLETFKEEELHHYQMFAAVHEDVHHRHTHTVGSRINVLDGKCLETWQNRLKSQYVIRELEERYGLEINQSSGAKDRRGLSRRQLEKQSKTGRKPVQLELQEILDTLLPQVTTVEALGDALRQSGVDLRLYQRATGELYGVSYEKDGVAFRGSDLGRKYNFKGLEQAFIQQAKALETHERRHLKTDTNRDNEASLTAARSTGISPQSITPAALEGLRRLREQRQTERITSAIASFEPTLGRVESALKRQQHELDETVDRLKSNLDSQQQIAARQRELATAMARCLQQIEQAKVKREQSKGLDR